MRPLTDRQRDIYRFYIDESFAGRTPSIREIGERFGIRSPNGVMCHLRALVKKGALTQNGNGLARSYRLSNDPTVGAREIVKKLLSLAEDDNMILNHILTDEEMDCLRLFIGQPGENHDED